MRASPAFILTVITTVPVDILPSAGCSSPAQGHKKYFVQMKKMPVCCRPPAPTGWLPGFLLAKEQSIISPSTDAQRDAKGDRKKHENLREILNTFAVSRPLPYEERNLTRLVHFCTNSDHQKMTGRLWLRRGVLSKIV